MRISAVERFNPRVAVPFKTNLDTVYNNTSGFNVVSLSDYRAGKISFSGNKRNNNQVIFIGAESDPYSKAGGVGTVMKDYRNFTSPENETEILPYYGGVVKNGVLVPDKDKDGDYIIKTNDGDKKLDLVSSKTISWGKVRANNIMLFSLKGQKNKSTYFVFADSTASMKKPYQGAYYYRTGSIAKTNAWNGDPYAMFSKAAVEFIPDVIKDKGNGFNPATVVCSDAQTAYVHEYMAKKAVDNSQDNPYDGIKPTYVGHNLGPGYCGETSMQNMFVNLGATPEQISLIENDPIYKDNKYGDSYFKPFVEKTLDETGTASAVMIPIHYTSPKSANGEGYSKAFTVVAEDYAESLANNPQDAHNVHSYIKQLYDMGRFQGILNPLEDPSVDSTKPLPNKRYNENCIDFDGTPYPAFKTYPANPSYKEMREIKNYNKLNLLKRITAQDNTILTGDPKRNAKINPEAPKNSACPPVRPDLINLIETGHGDDVPLYVSWGRADTQKGHNITLDAFEKFAKTKEGKNAILILGTGLDNSEESNLIREKLEQMLSDDELKGRIIHIDGWAPAYAMASAADAAIFSSRFEPCGLTDLEAMKYYCTPIVTNTQGFKQKNFDPRVESEKDKATSYKTKHEYNLKSSQIEPVIQAYVNGDNKALSAVKKEYGAFYSTSKDGSKYFDDTVFKTFADKYAKFIKDKEEYYINTDGELPVDYDDWDELSKDYNFKFKGFAREFKDSILSQEISNAIFAQATASKEEKELIFNNLKNLKTGWRDNSTLHPDSGKSTYELYKEIHLDPEYSKPSKYDLLGADDEFVENTIEKRQSKDFKERSLVYLTGALAGIGAIIANRTKDTKFKDATKEFEGQIRTLKYDLAQQALKYKKYMALTGILSAAAAAVITALGFRHYINSKTTKDEHILVLPKKPNDKNDVVNPKLSFSMSEFKNNLNKS